MPDEMAAYAAGEAPLVSVLIPTRERPERLWRALESVAAQTHPRVEAVVVNDGGAPLDDLIARFRAASPLPLRYVGLPARRGPAGARNAGALAATGALVALLDDDDRFRPRHLERLAAALAADPSAALAYDDALILIEAGGGGPCDANVVATCRLGLPYERARFDHDDYILTSAVVMRRGAFEAVGGFDATLPACEDWDLLLRLRELGQLRYLSGPVGVEYSLRVETTENIGGHFDAGRREALDQLQARYGLPRLEPKTFLDVARDLGLSIVAHSPGAPLEDG